ncbi:hypothetical protein BCD67_03250 [Oscillatoriales cyanobacterium USR001]|nr:hypothetical protein BCD67_03250 [Oscillatoriales cyanobacterium USR001]
MVMNEGWIARVKVWIERDFPNLSTTGYEITSPDTIDYNCIAWAAGDDQRWWWPDSQNIDYWPEGVPREVTVDAFIQAFQSVGYEVCASDNLESGFQKIAIYAHSTGKPTHATRQLLNGKWTSKLEQDEDIEHESLEGIMGEVYGIVVCIMKKEINRNS